MSDQEIHVRIIPQPQLPLILAAPLFMMIVGIVIAVAKFAADNFAELTSFFLIPFLVWRFLARRQYRTGRTVRAMVLTLGSCILAISAFKMSEWSEHKRQAAVAAEDAKTAAAKLVVWKLENEKACREHSGKLKEGKEIEWMTFDQCSRYYSRAQSLEICRPLIVKRALPRYGWKDCTQFTDEVLRPPR
ncbi:hypothetical protein ASF22_19540 [Methylobacterium sp. Leaf87]|uniref:hypothetical protein n=1 Tax=Methylobacterium sp. Leaf87 TaxID=1736243 RepID=UPI0006F52A2C|nr:hypothetical protein [Methylobacterium sp. Leaf87]KQO68751.1 hypothetical protein ASF22_19540 [Methylobacterium sp. Leaf87]